MLNRIQHLFAGEDVPHVRHAELDSASLCCEDEPHVRHAELDSASLCCEDVSCDKEIPDQVRDDRFHTGVMLNWIQHLFAGDDVSCDKEIPDQVRDDK